NLFTAKSDKDAKRKEDRGKSLGALSVLGSSEKYEFLQIIASIENESEHPLAKAIVEYAKENGVEFTKPESFKALPALGVKAELNSKQITIGSARLMSAEGLEMPQKISQQAETWKEAGQVV